MSRTPVCPLHLEWTPGWVRAVNLATGESAEAARLSELGSVLAGQRQALVGVGHSHVFLKALRLPKTAPDDLRNILGIQLGQLFPLPSDQLSFDFFQTDEQNAEGWLTIVGAIRSEDFRQIQTALKQVGLTPVRILPISLAAAPVAARAGRTDALVIARDPSGLALDVVQGGVLRFQRVAPADSDVVTEVQRTLAAARAGDLPIITTGAFEIPNAILSLDTPLHVLQEAPSFHFELTEARIQEVQRKIATRTRLAVLMMLSAILLVALVWVDRQDAQAVVTRSQGAWVRQLTTLNSIEAAYVQTASGATAIQTTLRSAFQPGQSLSDISAVVDDSLPSGAWLTGLTVERGKPLEVRGTAKTAGDVTHFVNALGTNPRFRDVRLVFANSATVGTIPVVQFNVSAMCVGNLPMPIPAKAKPGGRTTTTASASQGIGGI